VESGQVSFNPIEMLPFFGRDLNTFKAFVYSIEDVFF
jgi:hypothetical protein